MQSTFLVAEPRAFLAKLVFKVKYTAASEVSLRGSLARETKKALHLPYLLAKRRTQSKVCAAFV